ncbi:hypothetical protein GCM10022252_74960 [Streptosporangium oxazolinicum]|uniref:Uncharacterized protein n=1 Tax=Streptosporangium oxazolinicum TaxID=909287 RepID=A0ABP8BKB2_9ACTN
MTSRPLPVAIKLITEQRNWTYNTPGAARPTATAHLAVWAPTHPFGHLAVVADTHTGLTITNGIEHIWNALTPRYSTHLTLMEYWAPGTGADPAEHLDEAWIRNGQPHWHRIWPTPPSNPHHAELEQWIHGTTGIEVLETARRLTNP